MPPRRCTPTDGRALQHVGCGLLVLDGFIDFEADVGATPEDSSREAAWRNGDLINRTLATLSPGDTLHFPNKTFYAMGGISASGLTNVTIDLSGTIVFSDDVDAWPKRPEGGVTDCLSFSNLTGVVFTSSSGQGVLDGQGKAWWGLPWIGYLMHLEDRPKLFSMDHGRDILVENITFRNSPYWTFWAQNKTEGATCGARSCAQDRATPSVL